METEVYKILESLYGVGKSHNCEYAVGNATYFGANGECCGYVLGFESLVDMKNFGPRNLKVM